MAKALSRSNMPYCASRTPSVPSPAHLNNEKRTGTFICRDAISLFVQDEIRQRHRLAGFYEPIEGAVLKDTDYTFGMVRDEGLCRAAAASRPCIRRRSAADRAPLLHQRRLAEIRPGLGFPPPPDPSRNGARFTLAGGLGRVRCP
jgi:hypothetical protein